MGASKYLVLGAVGVGLAALFLSSKNAHAASSGSGMPAGWTPPSGATFTQTPAGAVPFVQDRWQWRNETTGGAPGTMVLITNHANPSADFVAYLLPDGASQVPQIIATGSTANSGLMAQAAMAGLS